MRKSTFRIVKADIHDDHIVILNDQNSGGYNLEDGETAVWGFSLTSDSLVSIITSQTSLLSAGNALHLILRDDDGKIAFEWSEPALPNVNTRGLMFLHKGRWHLSVTALGKQSYGSDRPVIVSVTGGSVPGGVEREYNDSFESATTIGTNSPLMWGALFNPASDVSGRYMDDDYWTFTLKRPAKTNVALSSTADAARACDFSLFDETGAPVEKDGLPLEGTSKGERLQTVLDCGELPAGKYYVKVSLGNASCWNSQYAIKVNADSSISLDECSIAVDQGSVFSGSEQKPLVVMKNASGVLLIEGQDYSVEYRDNVNAGYGTVVVKGMGAYSGERSETFRISPAVVNEPEAVTDLIYNAHEQVGVAHGDLFLVSGGSAIDAGSYTATVSLVDKQNYEWPGSGNSDDIEVGWSIAKALLTSSMVSDVPSSMEATGSQLAPEPVVTFNGKTLVQGVDYALSYGENVSPGKGTVTVTAVENGNFTGSVTVEFDIEKKAVPAPVFTDVDYSSWYGDAVSYVASKGLITGYADGVRAGQFGVGDVLTRAQLATILWRNACPDEYASYDPETAVDTTGIDGSADGMYYTAAANWAVKNGVITGFDREDGTKDFAADDDVSFEQLITILSRLCATDAELSAAGSDLSAFADGDLASSWSRGAFAWAAANGLVQGYDEPTGKYLRPGDPVARERVAVVLMRAFEMGIMK